MIAISFSCSVSNQKNQGRTASFDDNWQFIKANPEGAANPAFNANSWRTLDLPHDWSIEDLPNQSDSVIGPFTKSSPHKMRTGYTLGGTAGYRKSFTIDKANNHNLVFSTVKLTFQHSGLLIYKQ